MKGTEVTEVVYRRIRHAAHYFVKQLGEGHDLETWTFYGPVNEPPSIIPADAKFAYGSRIDGQQTWTYQRIAPMSPGTCEWCRGAK